MNSAEFKWPWGTKTQRREFQFHKNFYRSFKRHETKKHEKNECYRNLNSGSVSHNKSSFHYTLFPSLWVSKVRNMTTTIRGTQHWYLHHEGGSLFPRTQEAGQIMRRYRPSPPTSKVWDKLVCNIQQAVIRCYADSCYSRSPLCVILLHRLPTVITSPVSFSRKVETWIYSKVGISSLMWQ